MLSDGDSMLRTFGSFVTPALSIDEPCKNAYNNLKHIFFETKQRCSVDNTAVFMVAHLH